MPKTRSQTTKPKVNPKQGSARTKGPRTAPPWPRPDLTPFTGSHIDALPQNPTTKDMKGIGKRHPKDGPWGKREDCFYNAWLDVSLKPTRFLCVETLTSLGLLDAVTSMMDRLGVGTLFTKRYPLYPEAVTQFHASSIYFSPDEFHNATLASLGFLFCGVPYRLSVPEICDIYGFDKHKEWTASSPVGDKEFWNVIEVPGAPDHRFYKISEIRNPVLSIVGTLLATFLLGRADARTLTKSELALMWNALPSSITREMDDTDPADGINLGFLFVHSHVYMKEWGLKAGL